jgi:hypothetical protein
MKSLFSLVNKFLGRYNRFSSHFWNISEHINGFGSLNIKDSHEFVTRYFEEDSEQRMLGDHINSKVIGYLIKKSDSLDIEERFLITFLHTPFHVIFNSRYRHVTYDNFGIDLIVLDCFFRDTIPQEIFEEAIQSLFLIFNYCLAKNPASYPTEASFIKYIFWELYGLKSADYDVFHKLDFMAFTNQEPEKGYSKTILNGIVEIDFINQIDLSHFNNYLKSWKMDLTLKLLLHCKVNKSS